MVASWIEQRRWGTEYPLEALMGHPLRASIEAEFKEMAVDTSAYPTMHDPKGWAYIAHPVGIITSVPPAVRIHSLG